MTGWQPTPARGASAFLARQFGGPSGLAGIDPSPVARKSARCRNAAAIKAGRLALMTGDAKAAVAFGPADLIVACHILYFWALATDLIVARVGGRRDEARQLVARLPGVSSVEVHGDELMAVSYTHLTLPTN